MRAIACALGVAACLYGTRAEADVSKAWAAAKDNLPANTQFVVAVDVAAIYKSPLYAKAFEAFKGMDREIGEIHGMLKSACGWDPLSVIDGVVIAGDQSQKAVVAYVQLTIDRGKATVCFEKGIKAIANADSKGKGDRIKIRQDGDYTVASKGDGKRDSAYFPWVGSNVVVITMKPDHKDVVDAWWKQKSFGKSLVSSLLGKLDGKAAVAGAFASDKPIDAWVPITKAYGNWTMGAGKVSGALIATATDAKTAKGLADDINKDLQKDINRDRTPPSVKKIMGSISITASGSDLTIKGTATEKDLGDAFSDAFTKKKSKDEPAADPAAEADIIAKLEGFSKGMCACKDKTCADKVNADMTKWGTEMAKNPKVNNQKPSPDLAKRAADTMTRYTECMTKLYMAQPATAPNQK